MNPLKVLKSMLPLYHMRNKISCTTPVGDYLCSTDGTDLTVYYNNDREHGRLMRVSSIHRTKFHNVCVRFYSSDASKTFSLMKKNKHTVLFVAGEGGVWNNARLIDMNTDRDMYFNLSMELDIQFSYEEFKELCKLCSQINHDMAIHLR